MLTDAFLAGLHHITVFLFAALLIVEVAIVYLPLSQPTVRFLSRIDGALGIVTLVVGPVGVARLIWGAIPADFYLYNAFFWAKMTLLSVLSFFTFVPGIRIQRWHKASAADAAYVVPAGDITYVRRALWVEVAMLVPVPICAALMARGFGAFTL